jgi:hypothetical protein
MPMPRRSREPLVIYSSWLVIILVASFVFAYIAFRVYASLPYALQRAPWIGVVLNVIVPLLAGVISGAVAIYVLSRRDQFKPTLREHLFRAAPWYLLSCLLVLIVVRNEGIKDFGLWSQIITAPVFNNRRAVRRYRVELAQLPNESQWRDRRLTGRCSRRTHRPSSNV